jgi:hypothetical protein
VIGTPDTALHGPCDGTDEGRTRIEGDSGEREIQVREIQVGRRVKAKGKVRESKVESR